MRSKKKKKKKNKTKRKKREDKNAFKKYKKTVDFSLLKKFEIDQERKYIYFRR